MPCPKTLNLNLAAGDNFYPLHTAVYCAASGTILGSMGNYIVEFNATTAAVIRAVKVIAPMYGPTHLCLAGADPWFACYSDRSNVSTGNPSATHVNNDIFPVDPSTLLLGAGLGLRNTNWSGLGNFGAVEGPRQFLQVGTRIFFLWAWGRQVSLGYVDKTNHAITGVSTITFSFWSEHFCTDGTSLYTADPGSPEIDQRDANLNIVNSSGTQVGHTAVIYFPVATAWAANVSLVHAVTASKSLVRVDDFVLGTNTYIDLEALIGGVVTGIKPLRIRYRISDGKFYIPVQNKNGIIVYTPDVAPNLGSASWKPGFDSPVDVVFAPAPINKAFAVLSSDAGLKEIV